MSIFTGEFWRAAGERGIKSVAYSALSLLIGNGTGLLDTEWEGVLSVAAMAGIISLLGSIASDAATGGTGPSLTSAEMLSSTVIVGAPADAVVEADVTMPPEPGSDDGFATPESH